MNAICKLSKIALILLASMGLFSPVYAETSEKEKTLGELNLDGDEEIEFYDYHSGVTHTSVLTHFLYHSLEKNSLKQDKAVEDNSNK